MAKARPREYPFTPRIINPVKLERAILFAADAEIRQALIVLAEKMPWLATANFSDPRAVGEVASEEASVFLFDDTGLAVVDASRIRSRNRNAILVLLSFQPFIQCSPPQAAGQRYPYTSAADLVFAVTREEFAPSRILPSVVRAAEDRLNIVRASGARRFIFHLADDEPRWFSQFLPLLYNILGQRADVMISRTFEESLDFLFGVEETSQIDEKNYISHGHGDDVVCLIADIFFPKGSDLQNQAGQDLIRLVKRYYPRIPVIIASKAKEALELKDLGFILPKGDPGSLEKLREFILDFTGLGDFLVADKNGRELYRLKDLHGLFDVLGKAETETEDGLRLREILESYAEMDRFSTWFYMHGHQDLGDRLRPRKSRGRSLIALLKRNLQAEMQRMAQTPLTMGGQRIFTLRDLYASLEALASEEIQPYSDHDLISSWLDFQGYPELAEKLRPIHGSGPGLRQALLQVIEEWMPASD